jgi:hypothetical protein
VSAWFFITLATAFDGSKQLFDFWLLPLKNKLFKRQK